VNIIYNSNKMYDKADIMPRTLDSPIIQAGIRSLGGLDDVPEVAGLCLVVGGTAVQSYLPESGRRPTSDIDLSVVRPLNYSEFKTFFAPVIECLKDNGYEIETRKASNAFKVFYSNDSKGSAVLEFSRRNQRKFDSKRISLERELEHGRGKIIYGANCIVAAPEDIVVPKLVRGVGTLERNPEMYSTLIRVFNSDADLLSVLQHVIGDRAIANELGDPKRSEQSRIKADVYDVLSLAGSSGFNASYLHQVISEWDKMRNPSQERDFLFDLVSIPFK
jgi:hypothetical protein